MAKQYGLILPNKAKLTPAYELKKASIFDEESDNDAEEEKPTGITKTIKRQDRVTIEKAIEEDPTVYQYDEVYDEIDKKRKDSKLSRKDLDKKPKYINRLLAAADKRKRENERRIERQVQKERDAEGEEFKDKESFVTSAYRKKLEEFKKMEEEEQREEYLERIGDVTKQGNLDGFYRHLYDQKVNYEDENKGEEETGSDDKPTIKSSNQKRKYRKRESTDSEGNDEEQKKLEHLPSNLDADSDFSIDSSDSSDAEAESKPKKIKEEASPDVKEQKDQEEKPASEKEEVPKSELVKTEEKPKKPKVDIWKKRTVGIVFDEALQRYFERKALREAAVR